MIENIKQLLYWISLRKTRPTFERSFNVDTWMLTVEDVCRCISLLLMSDKLSKFSGLKQLTSIIL